MSDENIFKRFNIQNETQLNSAFEKFISDVKNNESMNADIDNDFETYLDKQITKLTTDHDIKKITNEEDFKYKEYIGEYKDFYDTKKGDELKDTIDANIGKIKSIGNFQEKYPKSYNKMVAFIILYTIIKKSNDTAVNEEISKIMDGLISMISDFKKINTKYHKYKIKYLKLKNNLL